MEVYDFAIVYPNIGYFVTYSMGVLDYGSWKFAQLHTLRGECDRLDVKYRYCFRLKVSYLAMWDFLFS